MVGTVEPRKGHKQVIAAFELLWQRGVDLDLVIVGRKGWIVDDLASMLDAHPEAGRRLFWIRDASDAVLDRLYARAHLLIAASLGEGFGLPLVEAARTGLPIVARDISVFREVAGEHAYYFSGTSADDLAGALTQWLELHREARHPRSAGLPVFTWAQSVDQLLDVVIGGRWNATWNGPRQDTSARSPCGNGEAERSDDARRRDAAARGAAQRPDDDPRAALSHERA
jgi:glycosyltransferase involved in cell wall biosynthesis